MRILLVVTFIILLFSCRERQIPRDGRGSVGEVPGHVTLSLEEMLLQSIQQIQAIPLTGDPEYDLTGFLSIHLKTGFAMTDALIRRAQNTQIVARARQTKISHEEEARFWGQQFEKRVPQRSIKELNKDLRSFLKKAETEIREFDEEGNIDDHFQPLVTMHHRQVIQLAELVIKYSNEDGLVARAKETIEKQEKGMEGLDDEIYQGL
ncbi:MAG: hypothetical protein ACK4ND_06315 [Cytophagaceae bacterium]